MKSEKVSSYFTKTNGYLCLSKVQEFMLSKNTIKKITSLHNKKFRKELGLFIAEGDKLVSDLLNAKIEVESIFCTKSWSIPTENIRVELIEISEPEMKKISSLSTPSSVLAVLKVPTRSLENLNLQTELTLALDDIQDPGNLGTIIRLADWFGIRNIVCSIGTVDVYSPKVVQATMGAIARVNVHYTDLQDFLGKIDRNKVLVYGTFMDGENLYKTEIQPNGIIVMGNEGNGISEEIEQLVFKRISVPSYPGNLPTSESLNVAMATAIICAEFRRRFTV